MGWTRCSPTSSILSFGNNSFLFINKAYNFYDPANIMLGTCINKDIALTSYSMYEAAQVIRLSKILPDLTSFWPGNFTQLNLTLGGTRCVIYSLIVRSRKQTSCSNCQDCVSHSHLVQPQQGIIQATTKIPLNSIKKVLNK